MTADNRYGIGIVGGVGPEAGLILHKHLLKANKFQLRPKSDQAHLSIAHLSYPSLVTDRTEFLLGVEPTNPAEGVYEVMAMLEMIASKHNKNLMVGIPCNTFHAKPIFSHLEGLLAANPLPHLQLENMIQATKDFIQSQYPNMSHVGLLSTTGTRKAKLYQAWLAPELTVLEVPEAMQEIVHQAIYSPEYGIKSSLFDKEKTVHILSQCVETLKAQGARAVILGCTELPIALDKPTCQGLSLIDPMRALAHQMVAKINLQVEEKPRFRR